MRINDILLEYDRTRALAALGKKFQDAVVKNAIRYWGSNWQQIPGAQEILDDPPKLQELMQAAIQDIEQADPTPNKKYTQWMARQFASGASATTTLEDVTSTLADYVHKFHKLNQKRRLQPPLNDINRYRDVYHLMDVLDDIPDDEPEAKDQAEKAYKDSDVSVVIPLDQQAACKYGRQTRWCTAAVHGKNYFDQYNKQGPLYILIPTQPQYAGEKYQLHFATGQFMDANDEPVDLYQLTHIRFPQLANWLRKQKDTYNSIAIADDATLQKISDDLWYFARRKIMSIYNEVSDDNWDMYQHWLDTKGYVDDDGKIRQGAPSYDEYNPNMTKWIQAMENEIHLTPKQMRENFGIFSSGKITDLLDEICEMIEGDRVGYHTQQLIKWLKANIRINVAPGQDPKVLHMVR